MDKISGIYSIVNLINHNIYIGSSLDINKRWSYHRWLLREGKHHNEHLQNAWDNYGENVFEFSVIERCAFEQLLEREQYYIDFFSPEYNLSGIAGRIEMSSATKAKISMANTGKNHKPETRIRMSKVAMGNTNGKGNKGKPIASDTKSKISQALIGNIPWNKGKKTGPQSNEVIARRSISMIGNKNSKGKHTDEQNQKCSASLKGKSWSKARRQAQNKKFEGTNANRQ